MQRRLAVATDSGSLTDVPGAPAGFEHDPATVSELARIVRIASLTCEAPAALLVVSPRRHRLAARSPDLQQAPDLATARALVDAPDGTPVETVDGVVWTAARIELPTGSVAGLLAVCCGTQSEDQLRSLRDLAHLSGAVFEAESLRHEQSSLQELIGTTVHDLRNPLSVLRAGLETLSEHRDQLPLSQQERIAELAMRQARRMSAMLDGLLALHGLDDEEAFEDVNLAELLRDVLESGRLIHQLVDLRESTPLPGGPIVVRGIPDALARLVTNLVTNAAIHGGGRVRVGLQATADTAVISIDDDGPGMPHDTPLDGGDASRGTGGHGLGLVIARRLADTHRGTITHRPRPSGGTHLELRLPLARRSQHVRLP